MICITFFHFLHSSSNTSRVLFGTKVIIFRYPKFLKNVEQREINDFRIDSKFDLFSFEDKGSSHLQHKKKFKPPSLETSSNKKCVKNTFTFHDKYNSSYRGLILQFLASAGVTLEMSSKISDIKS